MTTPFSGNKVPFVIKLLDNNPALYNTENQSSITSSTIVFYSRYIDFSKISGNFYFEVAWGHAALSTAGGSSTQIRLRDATNNTDLVTASTTTSANTAISGGASKEAGLDAMDVAFSTFTKPASTARIGVMVDVGDTTARSIALYAANIWVIP